ARRQPAVLRHPRILRGLDRVAGAGQHELQRPRGADRQYAGGVHGSLDRRAHRFRGDHTRCVRATMTSLPDATMLAGAALVVGIAFVLSAGLITLLRPLLRRYALARPNERSSHRAPTPQGGGIAVCAATIICTTAATFAAPSLGIAFFRDLGPPL